MIKEERYNEILKILDSEKYISAQELAKRLYVSLPTIRRDLSQLHKRGQIVRNHGGAKIIEADSVVAPLSFRKSVNSNKKRHLCKTAAQMIKEKDVIFIDSSTTTLQMADYIDVNSQVTVVTNGITLATILAKKGIKTYCTGGEIFENSLANFGSFAEEFIKKFNFDKMFFSCYGINDKGILTDPSLPETQMRKTAIEQSGEIIFMCDESKFSLSAPYNLMPIHKATCIITNSDIVYKYFDKNFNNKIIVLPD